MLDPLMYFILYVESAGTLEDRGTPATPVLSVFINSVPVLLTVSAYLQGIVGDVVLWGQDGVPHLLCS